MRIDMQAALAAATKAATRPSPSLPDSRRPSPEPPQMPEHESVTWLRATIEDDKAIAERATTGRWAVAVDDRGRWQVDATRWNDYVHDYEATGKIARPRSYSDAQHIALHDPQDTIARCEAELALLDMHGPNRYGYCLTCDPDSCGCVGSGDYPCTTARTILSGYRHREGFKPEWVNA